MSDPEEHFGGLEASINRRLLWADRLTLSAEEDREHARFSAVRSVGYSIGALIAGVSAVTHEVQTGDILSGSVNTNSTIFVIGAIGTAYAAGRNFIEADRLNSKAYEKLSLAKELKKTADDLARF